MPASPTSRLCQTLSAVPRLCTIFLVAVSLLLFLLVFLMSSSTPSITSVYSSSTSLTLPNHLIFGIASSARTWPRRRDYVRAWWRPGITRGLVFLDSQLPCPPKYDQDIPLSSYADTSRFPYSFKGDQRSSIRVARVSKELVDAFDGKFEYGDVRWVVLGDDDTVFFIENLAATLGKYDWEQWYYVGSYSESWEQNAKHFFDMAFGGGGFAISYPLAKVLSKVIDLCLMRYGHLFGSDSRIFACLTELGVGLTREPGFHQVDLRGDLYGLLSTHPMPPLVSLHHLDSVDPLFPGKNHSEALNHLLKAVNVDPKRILQQTICYDHNSFRTISISWGFSVQIFEGNKFLTDLLVSQKTFRPWKRGRNTTSGIYMFNTREFPRDPCKRPAIFFMENLYSSRNRIESNYRRVMSGNCMGSYNSSKELQKITVFSVKHYMVIGKAIRRHCCDVLDSSNETIMNINVRKCKDDELIAMEPY